MRARRLVRSAARIAAALALALPAAALPAVAAADGGRGLDPQRPPRDLAFTTVLATAPLSVEGLTADRAGNLYAGGRGGSPCPVYRVPASGGPAAVVGTIATPCNPAGITFGPDGRLYVADSGRVVVFTPDAAAPPAATVFVAGVPGANGLAFDRRGDLWVSDGTTGQGRVWKVGRDGVPREAFRVQPMVNEVTVVNGVGGIGRDPRSAPPATVTITPNGRGAANTEGSQHLVANGLAFLPDGALVIADTARGAVWKVELTGRGEVRSRTGCDTTFTPNTLCLDAVLVAHPWLEGIDGIVVDRRGAIWGTSNERNAIVTVDRRGRAHEWFRNPVDPATRLRNAGPMEFPTTPVLVGDRLCVTHSDGSRRDNAPATVGEGSKISCSD